MQDKTQNNKRFTPSFTLSPEEQLRELKKGVVDFISEEELLKKLTDSYKSQKPLRIKVGFDPSKPDLHLGHTVVINKMKQFQDLGHQVIFLIGDFTGLIGDPTGKNETRPVLTKQNVQDNAQTYAQQVYRILKPELTEIAYNSQWMNRLSSTDFIHLTSRYTIARMLERDDFEKRYKNQESICIHEFLYPLVQAYDSVALKADVELGGVDQKFNLLVGRDIQKSYGMNPQCILTVPILEGLDGTQKMSKSLNNYIAIQDSSKEMFGKIMRLTDELMIRYYELLTDKTVSEMEDLQKNLMSGNLHPRRAKVGLAKIFVKRFHSEEAAENAEKEFDRIFVNKGLPDDIPEHSLKCEESVSLCHLMVDLNLAVSNSEARRLIQGGGVQIEGKKIHDPQMKLNLSKGDTFIVRSGKKKFAKVVVS